MNIFLKSVLVYFVSFVFIQSAFPADHSNDSAVLDISREILSLLKHGDYYAISKYVHPEEGIRFSPYAYIDTASDLTFKPYKLRDALKRRDFDIYNWGSYDGTGDPILLTAKNYFKRFVYDADFLNAEKTSLNKRIASGNTISNLEEVYLGCVFTESYFSGFDEKYSGMDWRALRLVYKIHEGKYYLVGIIHDERTI
jgi:hypothetical protein